MREIKFRAWDKKGKKMIMVKNWWNCATEVLSQSACPLPCPEEYWDKNIVILQYTNLKDKNGKEIYESDVVKNRLGEKREVEFHNFSPFADSIEGWDSKECEVVGNIYSNPELLKKL